MGAYYLLRMWYSDFIMNEITAITANKIKTLLKLKTANYRAYGVGNPEVAAQYAVEAIVKMVMHQPKYVQQLLDEEIEDAIKDGKEMARTPGYTPW